MQCGEENAKGKIRPKLSKTTFEQDPSSGEGCQCHIPGVRQVSGGEQPEGSRDNGPDGSLG